MSVNPLSWFVNREKQYLGFQKMLAGNTIKRIMLIKAPADMGKSWLIQKIKAHCEELQIPTMSVNFADRREHDYLSLVRLGRDQLGGAFFNALTQTINNYTQTTINFQSGGGQSGVRFGNAGNTEIGGDVAGRDIIKDNQFFIQSDNDVSRRAAEIQINDAFFSCLTQLLTDKQAVFLFDSYEQISDEAERWLLEYLLLRHTEGHLSNALIIIAGRDIPQLSPTVRSQVATTGLDLFTEAHVTEYIMEKRGLTDLDSATLFRASGGFPGMLAKMADLATMSVEGEDDDWL